MVYGTYILWMPQTNYSIILANVFLCCLFTYIAAESSQTILLKFCCCCLISNLICHSFISFINAIDVINKILTTWLGKNTFPPQSTRNIINFDIISKKKIHSTFVLYAYFCATKQATPNCHYACC